MCKTNKDITDLGNKNNGGRFGCLSETKVLLIFVGRKNDSLKAWMSSLGRNSKETQVMDDQRIEPNENYGEVGHVTNSIDH